MWTAKFKFENLFHQKLFPESEQKLYAFIVFVTSSECVITVVTTRSRSGFHLLWRNTAIHARKRTRQSYATLSKLYLMPYLLSEQQHELSLTEAQRRLFKNDLDKKKISGLMIPHAIVSLLPVSTDENSMPI